MKVLVTGASGFVGKRLLALLECKGHKVIAHSFSGNIQTQGYKLSILRCDICDISNYLKESVDLIIHLAALGIAKRSDNYQELFRVNVRGSLEILRLAKACSAKVIVAGSFAEYGLIADSYDRIPVNAELIPTYPYAASKAAQSALCREFASRNHVDVLYLRLFNIFGRGLHQSYLWESLRMAAKSGTELLLSPGEQIRDFIHVASVVAVINQLTSECPEGYNALNVGSGYQLSIRQFAEYWWQYWGGDPDLLKFGAVDYRADDPMRYIPLIERNVLRIVRDAYDYGWCEQIICRNIQKA